MAERRPDGESFEVQAGETLLEAMLRNKLRPRYGCMEGSCAECKCRLLEGEVKERVDSAYVLEKFDLENGYVLACQSILKSDIVFTYERPKRAT